jgi:hypothetical protein
MSDKELFEKIGALDKFIAYCENTSPDDWATDVVRTVDGRNCLLGHFINYIYGEDYEGNIMPAWDIFEEMWATQFMFYPVNDGQSNKYQQPTAKERVIAYLKDLWLAIEKPTWALMDEYHGTN